MYAYYYRFRAIKRISGVLPHLPVLENDYDCMYFENMAGMAKRQNFKHNKTGKHHHSINVARLGNNTSLMLTIFSDFHAAPWPQIWLFCDHNFSFIGAPWYIKRRSPIKITFASWSYCNPRSKGSRVEL